MWVLEFLPRPGDTDTPQLGTGGTFEDTQSSTASGKKKNKKPYYHLVAGDFVVGRKNCDIIYNKYDTTISRQHARITVLPLQPEEVIAVGTAQTIQVTDLGSRYHTLVNDVQLPPQATHILRSGDVLTFGRYDTKARIWHKPLVLCLSRVSATTKQTLKEAAAKAGAHIVDKWRSTCTHLIVGKTATATTKVCLAVVNSRPVVDVKWLMQGVLGRSSVGVSLPEPAKYLPDWSSVAMVRDLNKTRNSLFGELLFLYVAADETEELVKDAGAGVEKVYEWQAGEGEEEEGGVERRIEDAKRMGGKQFVVVIDTQKTPLKKGAVGMMERLVKIPGVYVTMRQQVAESIFRNRPLCCRDGEVVGGRRRGGGRCRGGGGRGRAEGEGKDIEGGGGGEAEAEAVGATTAAATAATAATKPTAIETLANVLPSPPPGRAAATAAAAVTSASMQMERDEEVDVSEVVVANPSNPSPSQRTECHSLLTAAVPNSPSTHIRRQPLAAEQEEKEERKEEGEEREQEGLESAGKNIRKLKSVEEDINQAIAAAATGAAAAGAVTAKAAGKKVSPPPRGVGRGNNNKDNGNLSMPPFPSSSSCGPTATAIATSNRRPAAPARGSASHHHHPAPPLAPPSLLPFKPLDPLDGWAVAPRKKPPPPPSSHLAGSDEEEEDGLGEGRMKRKEWKEEEEQEEGETVVEERDLLVGGGRGYYFEDKREGEEEEEIEPMQYVNPSKAVSRKRRGREGERTPPPRPDFKRFRKNVVMEVKAEERIKRRDLMAVLPKESEMEVQLTHEEAMALAWREDGERLFADEDEGPRRRKVGRK